MSLKKTFMCHVLQYSLTGYFPLDYLQRMSAADAHERVKVKQISPSNILTLLIYSAIALCSGFGYVVFAQKLLSPDEAISYAQKTITTNGVIKKALFSPDDQIKKVLIGLIHAEQEHIYLAVFSLTDAEITQALIEAHHRGILVEVVADTMCLKQGGSKVHKLHTAGLAVRTFPTEDSKALMHNKFVVFAKNLNDQPILWTGSFNFTYSATRFNQENVLILQDADLAQTYIDHFRIVQARAFPFNPRLAYQPKSRRGRCGVCG